MAVDPAAFQAERRVSLECRMPVWYEGPKAMWRNTRLASMPSLPLAGWGAVVVLVRVQPGLLLKNTNEMDRRQRL